MSMPDTSPTTAATTSTSTSTGGETSLSALLSTLKITIHPETYVFATMPASHFHGNGTTVFPIPLSDILLFFREPCTRSASAAVSSHADAGADAGVETRTGAATSSPPPSIPRDDQITLILQRDVAERYAATPLDGGLLQSPPTTLTYAFPCRLLTCDVHSSLSAVGFMAVLATRLAERGISVNPVAGFYHDHLFVPVERAEEAVEVLEGGVGSGSTVRRNREE
ncbi:hypothetical protein G647_02941 [Cladophialophora carrionii CBS 160.54]|uniref:DUF2241 domain-containing protein n=1 Tax=Cladophialophora carrionii CBS 160.54 TaxID=1279043 RepID=V9DGY9_9EURO|nr:uncharacterized protein G647_02941 [Cladophialophora carrionii CBS 160.54]ETI26164.1 hypothetical protein G647_02941 [Cladophialophora carrionii CBS 160.54]